jgi:hypothetical protein
MHAKSNMLLGDHSLEGKVKNLSLKGAFVTADRKLGLDETVRITIDDTLACGIRAKLVRVINKEMGLRFKKTLLDCGGRRNRSLRSITSRRRWTSVQ